MKNKIVIIGLGAIGSVLTATLLENPDNKVKVIVKPDQYQSLEDKQLNIYGKIHKTRTIDIEHQIDFSLDNTLVIPMVKIYDLETIIKGLKNKICPSTKLLILTNGLNIRERILDWSNNTISHEQMYRGIIGFGATMKSIGHTNFYDGKITLEERFSKTKYFTAFNNSFLDIRSTPHIRTALWKKLIINSIYNPLSLIFKIPNNIISKPELNQLKTQILREGMKVAGLEGIMIKLTLEEINSMVSSDNITSMYQDYSFNRKTEIDYLNGEIVKIGNRNQMAVPVNDFLVSLVKSFELLRNNKLIK